MKAKVLVSVLFTVQSLFYFNLMNAGCCDKDGGLQSVNVILCRVEPNEDCKLFLVTTKPDDGSNLVCELFSEVVKSNFYVLHVDDPSCSNISDLIVFEQCEIDFDGKTRKSYDAFLMDTFSEKVSLHNDDMNCVEFARLKLFIEDEKSTGSFILVSDCVEVFKALVNNNKNRLFKNINLPSSKSNYLQKCVPGHNHQNTNISGRDEIKSGNTKEMVIKFPKSIIKNK